MSSNPWKGTKSPPWQKPGARLDTGRLQRGILRAFQARGEHSLATHDFYQYCYPERWATTPRQRDNRRRAVQRAAERYCVKVSDGWGWFRWVLRPEYAPAKPEK